MYDIEEAHPRTQGLHYNFKFRILEAGKGTLKTNAQWIEVVYWCREQFGPADFLNGRPTEWRWRADHTNFEFAREEDAVAFKIRWL